MPILISSCHVVVDESCDLLLLATSMTPIWWVKNLAAHTNSRAFTHVFFKNLLEKKHPPAVLNTSMRSES